MPRSSNRTIRNPDLRDLAAFAAVARTRNFRAAARELGIGVSTLSERLRDLEARLGVRLLNRTTRAVSPTGAGEELLGRISPALTDIEAATRDLGRHRSVVSGRLRINAPPPAMELVLAPMLTEFLQRYPDVSMEIVDDPLLIDIVSAGFDAGVRYEENLAKDMVAVSLGPEERYVVLAAPALLATHPEPQRPQDLLGAPCIVTRFPNRSILPWEFERGGKVVKIVPEGRLIALHARAQLKACMDGLGFFATFEGYAREAIDAGKLVTVLDDWCPKFSGPFLYYPGRRQNPPALTAFVDFIKERRARERARPPASRTSRSRQS
jgi:DNA-binding transcriptional LysR family regulator